MRVIVLNGILFRLAIGLSLVLYHLPGVQVADAVPAIAEKNVSILLQPPPLITLTPSGVITPLAGHELSGIVKSRKHPDIYWLVNDSGNPPNLIPVNAKGAVLSGSPAGIPIDKALNIDWEDLAIDSSGLIYICDTGNNWSIRSDLAVYLVRESEGPELLLPGIEKIRIRYPEQKMLLPLQLSYDCEAVFVFRDRLYLLTKRLSDGSTSLYRMDARNPAKINDLTILDTFPLNGYVTAADMSPDQEKLAVLTYEALWIFSGFKADNFFRGKATKILLNRGGQIEAMCFSDNSTVMIVNENENQIFTIPLAPYGF
jgi:hypothetical protein